MWNEKFNMEMVVDLVYKNGGTVVHGYGIETGGFSGGVDMDEAHTLMKIEGILEGVALLGRKDLFDEFFRMVGEAILADPEKYPVTDDAKKFIQEKWIKTV